MPEIKNTFTSGKMNKDLDERLVPNGEYRDAMNVEVASSDSDNVGALTNSKGNVAMNATGIAGATCVGSIVDSENDRVIWFISGTSRDAIVEFSLTSNDISPILVDTFKGTSLSFLDFSSDTYITGINILNGILFWTDNVGEPKKINIETMKAGLVDEIRGVIDVGPTNQIDLTDDDVFGPNLGDIFSVLPTSASDIKVVVDNVEDTSFTYSSPTITLSSQAQTADKVEIKLITKSAIFSQQTYYMVNGENRNAPRLRDITVARRFPLNAPSVTLYDTVRDGTVSNIAVFTTGASGSPVPNYKWWLYKQLDPNGNEIVRLKPPGTNSLSPFYQNTDTNPPSNPLQDKDGNDVKVYELYFQGNNAFQEGDIVSLTAPNQANDGIHTDPLEVRVLLGTFNAVGGRFNITILSISESLLDLQDTNINGGGSITWSATLEQEEGLYENVFPRFAYRWKYVDGEYSAMSPFTEVAFLPNPSGYEYDSELGHNLAMSNHARRIVLSDFDYKAVDAVEVDILVKNSDSNNVYVLNTIQTNLQLGENNNQGLVNGIGNVEILQESILSILPSNQILRHYDNVPLKALAQEVSANRVMYGNYVQQRDIPNYFEKQVKFDFKAISTNITSNYAKSVKSIREYQIGVAFLDDFGRQTPVFSTDNSTLKIGQINSNTKNYFTANLQSTPPEWATHLKYYIKENSNEYYNLALDRYYDNDVDDVVWLSFPSSESNKVTEDDYIILKKAHGSDESVFNNNGQTVKYKVLAKEDSAPDSIKYKKESLGAVNDIRFGLSTPNTSGDGYPVKDAIEIKIDYSELQNTVLEDVHTLTTGVNEKFLKIFLPSGGGGNSMQSDFYEVSNVTRSGTGSNDYYTFTLKTPLKSDVSFCREYYTSGTTENPDNDPGVFQFEYFENVNHEFGSEFKGRFFIKVKSDSFLKEKVLTTQNSATTQNYVSMAQNMRLIEWDGGATAGKTVDNDDYDITTWQDGTFPQYDSNNMSGYFIQASVANGRIQYWAVDKAQSWEENVGQVQGKGFELASNEVTFRFFGRIPGAFSNGFGWSYTNYDFYDRLNKNTFVPNTFDFYQKMKRGVGLKFKWYDDPNNEIYTVISSVIKPVKNFDSITNTNASGEQGINGVTFNFTLDKPISTTLSNFRVISNPQNTGDISKVLQIIEELPNETVEFTENPAIFEIEPKEQTSDLNLFYETPNSILIPKRDYRITCIGNSNFPNSVISSVNTDPVIELVISNNVTADIPAGTRVKIHNEASYQSTSLQTDFVQDFLTLEDVSSGSNVIKLSPINLNWFNCFAFGNGVESNRIRDDFNAPAIDKGPKVSSTFSGSYKEEHLKTGIIYSGIFTNKNGVNNSNQFIQAEKITKQINPEYGSIQKLFARNTNMVTFCEDKTVKVLVDKNALFNADGNPQLVATDAVLGQVVPFVGDYGISKNPESFANYGYRVYYTDKKKGAVLRLSGDGITNIAEKGMLDYFKTSMRDANTLLGSYDETKDVYNLTLKYPTSSLNTTVSFTERVNGWTSFKSFVPEDGFSLNGSYYTAYNGELWKHGVNEERNTYYGTFTAAKVKFIFNTSFSSVKTFRTLNYEGTTSRIYSTVSGQENQVATKGWYNNSIKTDLDSGQVPYFKDKENKWFNYIQGASTGTTTNEISEKSFQGLGFIPTPSTTSNFYRLTLNASLTNNGVGGQAIYDWDTGDGLVDGIKTSVTSVQSGTTPSNQTFTIVPKIVNGVQYVIAAADFSVQGTPSGIGTVTFANTTTASAIDNNITVTIPFSTSMPSADDTRSFTVIGAGKPRAVQL